MTGYCKCNARPVIQRDQGMRLMRHRSGFRRTDEPKAHACMMSVDTVMCFYTQRSSWDRIGVVAPYPVKDKINWGERFFIN